MTLTSSEVACVIVVPSVVPLVVVGGTISLKRFGSAKYKKNDAKCEIYFDHVLYSNHSSHK